MENRKRKRKWQERNPNQAPVDAEAEEVIDGGVDERQKKKKKKKNKEKKEKFELVSNKEQSEEADKGDQDYGNDEIDDREVDSNGEPGEDEEEEKQKMEKVKTSGSGIMSTVSFDELGFSEKTANAIKDMGFKYMTQVYIPPFIYSPQIDPYKLIIYKRSKVSVFPASFCSTCSIIENVCLRG